MKLSFSLFCTLVMGAVLLLAPPSQASTYQILVNVGTTTTAPQFVAQPYTSGQGVPTQQQTFHVAVSCAGACSATIQIQGSNDAATCNQQGGSQWINWGSAVTATGTNNGYAAAIGSSTFLCFGATVTAISGTNAKVNVTLSA